MAKIAKLRIHVAPVGYEVDRIVLPARQEKADRIWLMLHENRSDDKALRFIPRIKRHLEKSNIEIREEYHDRRDLFNIINSVKKIIEEEKRNEVYVNLASGSKIQAIGTMMACMMFNESENVHPFYVEAENYPGFEARKPISTGIRDIKQVPPYSIMIPDQDLVEVLKIIRERDGRISKKELAEIAEKKNLLTVNAEEKNRSMARFASLEQKIIRPLENQWKLIDVEKVGRTRWVSLNEEGYNVTKFL